MWLIVHHYLILLFKDKALIASRLNSVTNRRIIFNVSFSYIITINDGMNWSIYSQAMTYKS